MAVQRRAFSPQDVPQKKDDYHGKCQIVKTTPPLPDSVQSVNIELTFEEALKFSIAVQSAVLALNRYKRSTTKGRNMGLCLSLKLPAKSFTVIEQTVRDID